MPWNAAAVNSEILAVHAALVPSGSQGEVVLFGGDEHWSDQQESAGGGKFKKTRLYDVQTHAIVAASVPSPDSDVFCSHHAFAADGRLLIAGGTSKWPEGGDAHGHDLDFLGHRRCWLYSPRGRRWTEAAQLNKNPDLESEESGGRWYPGLLTLGNGDVLALFGHPEQQDTRHRNTLPERYNQAANTWVLLPKQMAYPLPPSFGGTRFLFFARSFVLPDGKVFFATPMPVDFETAAAGDGTYYSTRYDPATGDYQGHKIPEPGFGGYLDWSRPAVLLPLLPQEGYRPRVLFCGETGALKIDLGDPNGEWQPTAARPAAISAKTRVYSNAAVLPTGQVCLLGGVNVVNPEEGVNKAELYDPGIDWNTGSYTGADSWALDPGTAAETRNYHSVALLLPNGKVWVSGSDRNGSPGDPNVVGVKTIELFEPDYIAVANRLQITASPRFVSYGEAFELVLDRPATNVQRVALIRNGSVTHSTNSDQRYVGLEIVQRNGNTLTVQAPPSGNVAPPGYYMLWVVDTAGGPCQLAPFARLGYVGCSVFTDRSTFSQEEIASLGGGGQATINNALYLYFDGFLDAELSGTPTFTLTWEDTNAAVPASQLTLVPAGRLLESADPDVPQRITFPFHVRFPDTSAFATFTDTRQVRVSFSLGAQQCSETIDLTKSPNPYMLDINPAINNPGWLSTDVRVFASVGGMPSFGDIPQGTGADAPHTFIRAVLDRFNAPPSGSHPFLSILEAQASEQLYLATDIFGMKLYNYAVAKVRYRATTTTAQRVKVFFRLFNTVGTALEFNTATSYRNSGGGAGTVPLLGVAGGEITSIPFFVGERVETRQGRPGASAMTTQPLDPNYEIKDIAPATGEVTMYFGCWLDINQTQARFPIAPGASDGPWNESTCKSIQELVRGRHQCLVAEVYFEPDPTLPGETPGSSDNLSQRNLAILFSSNPGSPASRTVTHTLELKPSSLPKLSPQALPEAVPLAGGSQGLSAAELERGQRHRPDELLFRWYNLPPESEVTLYFADIDTAEIMQLAALRLSPVAFKAIDQHTISFRVADACWLPLPGGRELQIPALLNVKLPPGVRSGERYRVSVHQVSGVSRQVIGSFELTIPVSKEELIVEDEVRNLSVLKHIATTIPPNNRWYPIFQRYLHLLGAKVNALGGDADAVQPNPDGSGRPYLPPPERPRRRLCLPGWATSLVAAVALALVGLLDSASARAAIGAAALVLLALIAASWWRKCGGRIRCALLEYLLLGSSAAIAVLAISLAAGASADFLPETIGIAGGVAALTAIGSFVFCRRGECCDREDPDY